jgi:hypothetical protein
MQSKIPETRIRHEYLADSAQTKAPQLLRTRLFNLPTCIYDHIFQ